MPLSEFSIRRPIATALLSVALILAGAFSYLVLPIAALPRTDFPVINVSASLPGASPDTMATSVATPLIKQFATIAGIDTISTTNSLGSTSISIEFVLGRNIDAAAADVQAAITRTLRLLPQDMPAPPSYRKVNPADAPVLLLALKSNTVPLTDLDAIAQQVISPTLSVLDGVAEVSIFGSQQFAVRIQMHPDALTARGISVDALKTAVAAANDNSPLGTARTKDRQVAIVADTQRMNAANFSNIIIKSDNGKPVRLGDVATVIDSIANDQTASWHDGSRAIILAILRQPDANTVQVVDRVQALLPSLRQSLPAAASIETLNDRSVSVRGAVHDVQFTLALTVGLVILVIFVFVRRLWATLIPALAVPISIIATFAAMYPLGFSIDNISLMALTLSVGLVVDDAIVMLENIVRHMEEEGSDAFSAALAGSKEIGFTIVAISLSLVAVFIPVLLMGGVIGRILHEFAVVVTVAILASAFVSLTLTPMLAARLPANSESAGGGVLTRLDLAFERGFARILKTYEGLLSFCIRQRALVLLLFLFTVAITAYQIVSIPKGFFPQEDIGQLQVTTRARQDISFAAMSALQSKVEAVFAKSPYVAHVASTIGSGGASTALNTGRLFVELKPKRDRPPLETVLAELRRELAAIPGIQAFMSPIQNLSVGSRASASQYQLVLQSLDQPLMNEWAQKLRDAMSADRAYFTDVNSDLQINAPQTRLVVDLDKAATLGVDASQLRTTLYGGFGAEQISTIYTAGDSYEVIMELDPSIEWSADRFAELRVGGANGALVPLGAFARIETVSGPLTINQLGQLPAVTISFNLPAQVALGNALAEVARLKTEIGMPSEIATRNYGTTQLFQDAAANQGFLVLAAIVTIYLVLGVLYESLIHPLTVLSGLPSAISGALLAIYFCGFDLSIIAIVGVLMLIGIVKKNAIMMIDVALALQRSGSPAREAIQRACLMRFRPIMMTSAAAIMSTLPIAIGSGASAELRQPLGVAVVGGLLVSQFVTLFVTPVIYLYMEDLTRWISQLFQLGSFKVRRERQQPAAAGRAVADTPDHQADT
ncbi:efflux RND transporter permease subunit [Ensifer adhaerens]|uniref:efflux RND transporter permease subunit n=1 Tax=Ensifer adhaerens TaxID=106592 RepID=UPI001CC1809F|nr:efflux RND transporter permease subunit [Ensifer adhaerens]MBZ7925653.1 efflux RND transporter permease subunit [Ensifer adhaerens]UAX95205.1 efflux RND transporter permease subunit [Ensifer adhaerens]UAY02904.1 efflux RND transporter permease subunit [Ensifer adhaerens]UAY10888.1 efflux RND transporter permease subunit [Ensifer adhaerens]